MASAAAVAADQARSPLRNDIGEDDGLPGTITSSIVPKDSQPPGLTQSSDIDKEEEDEDLPATIGPRRGGDRSNGTVAQEDEGGLDDDLFGDEDDVSKEKPPPRQLDDEELDSGDDLERRDREPEEEEQEYVAQERVTMDLEISRQPVPEPSDGEMYLLKLPDFLAIEPLAWNHTTFQPPTTDHHSSKPPTSTFSAYNTALTTIRWRRSPSNTSKLQSNARINRWSDGSLTLQFASDPTVQYEVAGNALAAPQRNPIKPTPTSVQTSGNKGGRPGVIAPEEKYNHTKDAFTYLLRPHEASDSLLVTHKLTAGLSIKAPDSVEDDAIERLQASLAAAANASKVQGATGDGPLLHIGEDPEKKKEEALKAVREQERANKRRQAAIDRETSRNSRVLGSRGLSYNRSGGLNVGMLEDEEDGGGRGRRPGGASKPRPKKPRRRRNSEYSEDEDFGHKRFSREDEYDEEDDFVAPSDEEEEVGEDEDEDPDDGIVEEPRQTERRPEKRDRPVPAIAEPSGQGEDEDAPGEEDDDPGILVRSKRRKVIDEEDEED